MRGALGRILGWALWGLGLAALAAPFLALLAVLTTEEPPLLNLLH